MIDVFVRMAATPALAGVVAESVRWGGGVDPQGPQHQVVTLFGDPSLTHLTWALAAAYYRSLRCKRARALYTQSRLAPWPDSVR